MRKLLFTVEPEWDGVRTDTYLKRKGFSRRLLVELKHSPGGITRGGETLRTVDILRAGDTLLLHMAGDSRTPRPNTGLSVPVVYEDEDVVVFSKPPGMPVHPSQGHRNDTLANAFAVRCPGLSFRPVNRLDRDTSGLCVAAKNAHAASRLQHSLKKVYFAVLCGTLEGNGVIDAPIARAEGSIIRRRVSAEGKRAVTEYAVLASGNGHTLVRALLHTGRTHQIRVHFSHMGFPLAGDDLYGGSVRDTQVQALHCGRAAFMHPVSGEPVELALPLREDMLRLMGGLGGSEITL